MVKYRTAAAQVEIGMICRVENRIGIGIGVVRDTKCTSAQRICHRHVHIAGVALFSVGKSQRQLHAVVSDLDRCEDTLVHSDNTAVNMSSSLFVTADIVFPAVNLKATAGNTVCVSADSRTEISAVFPVFCLGLITEDNVCVFIYELLQCCTVKEDMSLQYGVFYYDLRIHRLSVFSGHVFFLDVKVQVVVKRAALGIG